MNRGGFFPITLISVTVAFLFRAIAVREHWPSIVPCDAPPPARTRLSNVAVAFCLECFQNPKPKGVPIGALSVVGAHVHVIFLAHRKPYTRANIRQEVAAL